MHKEYFRQSNATNLFDNRIIFYNSLCTKNISDKVMLQIWAGRRRGLKLPPDPFPHHT
jgi:hypothetical protein